MARSSQRNGSLRAIGAIAWLTWKAAARFRLLWVLAGLLVGAVVLLPLLIRDDGTARGFVQIMLTYTLSVITTLLGISTLWLACGTLARDIEECQMQMVAVKPIARWQIWLGKWLGILLVDATLLVPAGGSVYALLQWRAHHLPPDEQAILRNEIFVARGSLREPAPDVEGDVQHELQKLPNFGALTPSEQEQTREQVRERVKALYQVVPPNHRRQWKLDLGWQRALLKDQPLFLRAKFHVAQTNASGTYLGIWWFGGEKELKERQVDPSLAADSFHEVPIPPNLLDESGRLTIMFENQNQTAVMFPLDEDLEVLYREGGFALNYARGLAIIFCWLALLAALGLASASLLSFPVAAFFSLSVLVVALSSGTLASVVKEGGIAGANHETSQVAVSWVDYLVLPLFRAILSVVNLVQGFSPVESLSTGRSITWGHLGVAVVQVVLVLGGLIGAVGMILFTRRELAAAQGTH